MASELGPEELAELEDSALLGLEKEHLGLCLVMKEVTVGQDGLARMATLEA